MAMATAPHILVAPYCAPHAFGGSWRMKAQGIRKAHLVLFLWPPLSFHCCVGVGLALATIVEVDGGLEGISNLLASRAAGRGRRHLSPI